MMKMKIKIGQIKMDHVKGRILGYKDKIEELNHLVNVIYNLKV